MFNISLFVIYPKRNYIQAGEVYEQVEIGYCHEEFILRELAQIFVQSFQILYFVHVFSIFNWEGFSVMNFKCEFLSEWKFCWNLKQFLIVFFSGFDCELMKSEQNLQILESGPLVVVWRCICDALHLVRQSEM